MFDSMNGKMNMNLKVRGVPVFQPFTVEVDATRHGGEEWMVYGIVVGYGTFLIPACDDYMGDPDYNAIVVAAQQTVDRYVKKFLRNAGEVV